jgi:hypothetical protein
MTKKKPPTGNNPPEAFAAAFKSIGGIAALAKWARSSSHNRAAFYSLYSKLFPVEMKSEVKVSVKVAEEAATQAALKAAFLRVMNARPREAAGNNIKTIEHEPTRRKRLVDDVAANVAEPPAPPRSEPRLVTPDATPPTPGAPSIVRLHEPTFPGLASGAALDEGADDSLSTTERYLRWRGHGAPP